jgi:hypothetical protein
MNRYHPQAFHLREGNAEIRMGIPTKTVHKAWMHWSVQEGYTLCIARTYPETTQISYCQKCQRSSPEKRYVLPVIVYRGRGWSSATALYWEINHATAEKIAHIVKVKGNVDLLVSHPMDRTIQVSSCTDRLLDHRGDKAALMEDITRIEEKIPLWPGYVRPTPPPPREPPKPTRVSIIFDLD